MNNLNYYKKMRLMEINNKKKEYANKRNSNRMKVQIKVIKRQKKSQVGQKSKTILKTMNYHNHLKKLKKIKFLMFSLSKQIMITQPSNKLKIKRPIKQIRNQILVQVLRNKIINKYKFQKEKREDQKKALVN